MKKIGLIVLALVMALGALGVGYAYWSQTLTINGTVSTGELDAELVYVGSGDLDGEDGGTISGSAQGYIGTVAVGNAYPGYQGRARFTVHNTGTIPIYIKNVTVINETNPGVITVALLSPAGQQVGVGQSADLGVQVSVSASADEQSLQELAQSFFDVFVEIGQINENPV